MIEKGIVISGSNVAVVSTLSRRFGSGMVVGPASVPVVDFGRQGRRPYRLRSGLGAISVAESAKQSILGTGREG